MNIYHLCSFSFDEPVNDDFTLVIISLGLDPAPATNPISVLGTETITPTNKEHSNAR